MSASPGKAPTMAPNRRQRRHPRYRCEFPVEISLFHDEGPQQLNAHCRDLSEAGIGLLVAAELTAGEVASMRFTLPGLPQAWEMRMVLRHRRGYHYGFEFLSLSRQQVQTLKDYLPSLPRADSED